MSPTVARLLEEAAHDLAAQSADLAAARRDAQVLLGHALDVSRAWLTAHGDDPIDRDAATKFRMLARLRRSGHPVAYLLGHREFYGLEFHVTPEVLIPRPETELLVEAALARIPQNEPTTVLDLGTGSGAIAVAIATERPIARLTATDRSRAALQLAAENAQRLSVVVDFVESDWFAALDDRRFDLIVSNPPYVAASDPHLGNGDLRFEPLSALASGPDGLADIRRIVGEAPRHLHADGWLLLEHGYDQAQACRDLLLDAGFVDPVSIADLAGTPRVAGGRLLTPNSRSR